MGSTLEGPRHRGKPARGFLAHRARSFRRQRAWSKEAGHSRKLGPQIQKPVEGAKRPPAPSPERRVRFGSVALWCQAEPGRVLQDMGRTLDTLSQVGRAKNQTPEPKKPTSSAGREAHPQRWRRRPSRRGRNRRFVHGSRASHQCPFGDEPESTPRLGENKCLFVSDFGWLLLSFALTQACPEPEVIEEESPKAGGLQEEGDEAVTRVMAGTHGTQGPP